MQNQEESGQRTRQVTAAQRCFSPRFWEDAARLLATPRRAADVFNGRVEAFSWQLIFIDGKNPSKPGSITSSSAVIKMS